MKKILVVLSLIISSMTMASNNFVVKLGGYYNTTISTKEESIIDKFSKFKENEFGGNVDISFRPIVYHNKIVVRPVIGANIKLGFNRGEEVTLETLKSVYDSITADPNVYVGLNLGYLKGPLEVYAGANVGIGYGIKKMMSKNSSVSNVNVTVNNTDNNVDGNIVIPINLLLGLRYSDFVIEPEFSTGINIHKVEGVGDKDSKIITIPDLGAKVSVGYSF